MFGIGTKSAKLIAAAGLAVGVSVIGLPSAAEAGGDRWGHGGQRFHGQHNFKNFGHKPFRGHHGRGFYGHGHHGHRFHGHGHHGVTVHVWRPFLHGPVVHHGFATRACHPVVGHGFDAFGRQGKFGGTMCYDGFGNGYVVAGSQHVIHYF